MQKKKAQARLKYNEQNVFLNNLMPNPFYTYILDIYILIWLGLIAYQPLLVI